MRNRKQLLKKRGEVRERASSDMEFRREVLQRCDEDILYWFDNFAWTLDPREEHSELAFILYEGKQIEFVEWLEDLLANPRDGFVHKCRDVGATSMVLNWILYHWLFDDYFNARVGSRKEDYVDKTGDPDTLFYKVDYTFERLPDWMVPNEWNEDRFRSHMKLARPDNSNSIVGESANPSFARGGRQKVVLFDEIGFWNYAKASWQSAGDVTEIRLAMTTPPPTGKSSFAYKLLQGKEGNIDTFEFSWRDIPTKTEEWFSNERDRRSKEELEREVLKSYSGTVEGKVYAAEWRLHVEEGSFAYDPNKPLFVAWDFGLDETAMIWLQKDFSTNEVFAIDSYHNSNKTIDFYVPFVTGQIISGVGEYSEEELEMIKKHRSWRKDVTHYGDPDVKKRNLTNKDSAFKSLKEHGIYVQSKSWAGKTHYTLREKTKLLLRRLYVDWEHCQDFIEAILSAMYPERSANSQATTEIKKPVHDWTSHFRTALEYFADNEPITEKSKQKEKLLKQAKNAPPYRPSGGYK
jgi:hypothetical protein